MDHSALTFEMYSHHVFHTYFAQHALSFMTVNLCKDCYRSCTDFLSKAFVNLMSHVKRFTR